MVTNDDVANRNEAISGLGLVIFVDGDFTQPTSGSHKRFADSIDYARATFPKVMVYAHRQHATVPWTSDSHTRFASRFPDVELILDDVGLMTRLATRFKNLALALFPGRSETIAEFAVKGQTPLLRKILDDPGNTLLVHFTDGLTALNGVPVSRVIVDTHDIKFVRRAKITGTPLFSLKSLFRMRSELGLLAKVQGLVAISAVEAGAYRVMLVDVPSFFVPSFWLSRHAAVRREKSSIDILFVGSDMSFNVDGLTAFLTANRAALEGLKIVVCGSVCATEPVRQAVKDWPSLELRGFVDDLDPVYAAAKSVISPVDGTGLKIKMLEALAHGVPVFASSHSRNSLPGGFRDCVFDLDLQAIRRFCEDDDAQRRASAAALVYSENLTKAGDLDALTKFIRGLVRH